jgi:hypothetical protein
MIRKLTVLAIVFALSAQAASDLQACGRCRGRLLRRWRSCDECFDRMADTKYCRASKMVMGNECQYEWHKCSCNGSSGTYISSEFRIGPCQELPLGTCCNPNACFQQIPTWRIESPISGFDKLKIVGRIQDSVLGKGLEPSATRSFPGGLSYQYIKYDFKDGKGVRYFVVAVYPSYAPDVLQPEFAIAVEKLVETADYQEPAAVENLAEEAAAYGRKLTVKGVPIPVLAILNR